MLFKDLELSTTRDKLIEKVLNNLKENSVIINANEAKLKDSMVFILSPDRDPWSDGNVDLRTALYNADKAILPYELREKSPDYAVSMIAVVLVKSQQIMKQKILFNCFDDLINSTMESMQNHMKPVETPSVADDLEDNGNSTTRSRTNTQYVVPGSSYKPKGVNSKKPTTYENRFNLPIMSGQNQPYWTVVSNLNKNLSSAVCELGLENIKCNGRTLNYVENPTNVSELQPEVTLVNKNENFKTNDDQAEIIANSKNIICLNSNEEAVDVKERDILFISASYRTPEKKTKMLFNTAYQVQQLDSQRDKDNELKKAIKGFPNQKKTH